MNGLSDRVRLARTRRGLPMHALAARAALSNAYVSLLERGQLPDPRCSSLVGLAAALGVSLDWLILGAGPEPVWACTDDAAPSVYFAKWADGEAIKIGFSLRPLLRVRQLATGAREGIELLATMPGTRGDERALHQRFASARLRGEWFRPVPELLALIDEAKAA